MGHKLAVDLGRVSISLPFFYLVRSRGIRPRRVSAARVPHDGQLGRRPGRKATFVIVVVVRMAAVAADRFFRGCRRFLDREECRSEMRVSPVPIDEHFSRPFRYRLLGRSSFNWADLVQSRARTSSCSSHRRRRRRLLSARAGFLDRIPLFQRRQSQSPQGRGGRASRR